MKQTRGGSGLAAGAVRGWCSALGVVLLASVTATACKEETRLTLRDTEGRTFRAACKDSACTLDAEGQSSAELEIQVLGRLMGVCPRTLGNEADCRALVCQADADCPPARGMLSGSCIAGLCSEPSGELSQGDATMLCLAGTGLGHATPEQVSRLALALNCGQPCKIPKPCRRP